VDKARGEGTAQKNARAMLGLLFAIRIAEANRVVHGPHTLKGGHSLQDGLS